MSYKDKQAKDVYKDIQANIGSKFSTHAFWGKPMMKVLR